MKNSVSFDRAADYYDATRALDPHLTRRVLELLTAELSDRGPCLEIGIGTGRLALPLAEAGIPITGVDLSATMLKKLLSKTTGISPIPAARADATSLPFAEGTFGAAYACWVLHLIPEWRIALRELVRVVKPGGVILIDLGGRNPHLITDVRDKFLVAAGASLEARGTHDIGALTEVMASLGGSVREIPPIVNRREVTPEATVALLEAGMFSISWDIDAETRMRAGGLVREWATKRYGSLDEPVPLTFEMHWRAYDL
ncbi:MAG: class I SAM-dependent methyltransferase [Actinomycetota bacterium]